jgi:hypothetical protein
MRLEDGRVSHTYLTPRTWDSPAQLSWGSSHTYQIEENHLVLTEDGFPTNVDRQEIVQLDRKELVRRITRKIRFAEGTLIKATRLSKVEATLLIEDHLRSANAGYAAPLSPPSIVNLTARRPKEPLRLKGLVTEQEERELVEASLTSKLSRRNLFPGMIRFPSWQAPTLDGREEIHAEAGEILSPAPKECRLDVKLRVVSGELNVSLLLPSGATMVDYDLCVPFLKLIEQQPLFLKFKNVPVQRREAPNYLEETFSPV